MKANRPTISLSDSILANHLNVTDDNGHKWTISLQLSGNFNGNSSESIKLRSKLLDILRCGINTFDKHVDNEPCYGRANCF